MNDTDNKPPPIQRFAEQFKLYGLYLGVVVASIPLLTNVLTVVPAYASDKSTLTFATSLVSYFAVAIVFSMRRRIGSAVFPAGERVLARKDIRRRFIWGVLVPGICAIVCLLSLLLYLVVMDLSVEEAALRLARVEQAGEGDATADDVSIWDALEAETSQVHPQNAPWLKTAQGSFVGSDGGRVFIRGRDRGELDTEGNLVQERWTEFESERGVLEVLRQTPSLSIPKRPWIALFYVLMFLGAVVAFVWMGVVEYVQSTLGLSDEELLKDPYRRAKEKRFQIPGIRDLSEDSKTAIFFQYSYNPDNRKIVEDASGPYCGPHGALLKHWVPVEEDRHLWGHTYTRDKKTHSCTVVLEADDVEMIERIERTMREQREDL